MIGKRIKLIVHVRDGAYWDITELISYVRIDGTTSSASRTLETELLQSVVDTQIKQIGLVVGSTVCFYENDIEIYRGNVVDVSKGSNGANRIIAKDIGYTLSNAKFNKNCIDKKPEDITKEILKECRLKVGTIVSTGIKVSRFFKNTSAYDIIMTLYTMAHKQNKKNYMLNVNIDKVEVIERGTALSIQYTDSDNIFSSEISSSVDELISSVSIVNRQGSLLKTYTNSEIFKLFRFMKNEIIESENASEDIAKKHYKGVTHSISLSGLGDSSCKNGHRIKVTDNGSGLVGIFYIDSDTHEWSNGNYKCSLKLNFENIMDEKESGEDSQNSNGGTSTIGTKDWGHGINAEQLNKVLRGKLAGKGDIIIKYCNMYKVNPAVVTAIMCNESAYGTSRLATAQNNFFGMRSRNGWMSFSSVEEGIKRGISNISRNYINKGLNSFQKMVGKYAEGGGAWIPTNESIIKKITGKNSSQINFGTGVVSDSEAEKNIVYSGNSIGTINGINGYKFVNQRQKIIVEEAYRMIGRGRYTYGGRSSIMKTDCSGFIWMLHKMAGISIGSATRSQMYNGRSIPLSQIQAGDFIVMDSQYSPSGRHVVLCVGNGKIIHNGGPTGAHITIRSLYTYGEYTVRRCWE